MVIFYIIWWYTYIYILYSYIISDMRYVNTCKYLYIILYNASGYSRNFPQVFGFPFFFETAPENSPCCWQSAPWSNSDRDCSCPDGIVQRNLCWPAPQLISAPLGERGPIVLRLKQNRPGGNPAKALGVPGLEAQNSKVSVSNPSTISNCKGTGDNLPWNP